MGHPSRSALRSRFVRKGLFMVLFASATLAASACGGDGPSESEKPDAGNGNDGQDSGPGTIDIEGCVVSVLATDCNSGLAAPHQVELLNAKTGEVLPGFRTSSASGGKYAFKNVPAEIEVALHVIGVGPASEAGSTYDSIAFYVPEAGENLMRVSSVGTAGIAGASADFTPADDKVALSGAVYQADETGKRVGTIGCAQIFVDDQPHPATAIDQRYNASSGIPTTLRKLTQTLAGSGRFYLGNLSKGSHTLKVTLDNGRTFIAERTVLLSKTRAEAQSPFKSLLYLLGIDVKGQNPTPAGCPSEEAP